MVAWEVKERGRSRSVGGQGSKKDYVMNNLLTNITKQRITNCKAYKYILK